MHEDITQISRRNPRRPTANQLDAIARQAVQEEEAAQALASSAVTQEDPDWYVPLLYSLNAGQTLSAENFRSEP